MKAFSFEAIAKIDSHIAIGIAFESNGLFEVDMNTGKCNYICMIANERVDGKRLYTAACVKENKVYFVPYTAEEIAVYDINTRSVEKIQFQGLIVNKNYKKNRNFNGLVEYKNYIFMIPCTYPAVVRINTQNNRLDYFGEALKNVRFLFRKAPERCGEKFYIPSTINNLVFEFDMKKCIGKLYQVGQSNNGCWSMCVDGENFWLAPNASGPIIKWNQNTNECVMLNGYPEGYKGDGQCFTKAYVHDDMIYMIPAKANMGIRIGIDNMKIEMLDIPELEGNSETAFMFQMDGFLFLNIKKEGIRRGIRLNLNDNSVIPFSFKINDSVMDFKKDYANGLYSSGEAIRENSNFGLEDLIKGVIEL